MVRIQRLTFGYGKMRGILNAMLWVLFLLVAMPLVLGASWSAYVLDADSGLGIDAVNVTAVRVGTGTYVNSILTDALGFFNISISDLTPVNLVSSKTGYATDTSQNLPPITPPITDDEVLLFNITLTTLLPGNIIGNVMNSSGEVIVNANISAIQGNSILYSVLTNAGGDYNITNVTDGTYTLGASATGYLSQNVTNVVVQPNVTTEVNFTLVAENVSAPIPSPEPTTAGGGGGFFPCPFDYAFINRVCVKLEKTVPGEREEEPAVEGPAEAKTFPPIIEAAIEKEIVPEEEPSPIPLGVGIVALAIIAQAIVIVASISIYRKYKIMNSGEIMHKRLYKALHKAHVLIRGKDFKKAMYLYHWIKNKYDHLSRKAKRKEVKLHRDLEKLHDEVKLYLMIDQMHKTVLDGDMRGIRQKMHAVLRLANKVAREVPKDRALYSYARRQYEHCRDLLKVHETKS